MIAENTTTRTVTTAAPYQPRPNDDGRPHISVVTPVYRAEKCILELEKRLTTALSAITEDYEIILVEDAGGDRSWEIICSLAEQDHRVRGLQFSRNFGQHFALTAGVDHARGDWIVTLDCDLQDPPESIKALYDKALEGNDLVLARRTISGKSITGPFTSRVFYRVFDYLTDTKSDLSIGVFRIFSRRVRDNFVAMREQARFFGGMMQWLGFPSAAVDVPRRDRFAGESTYDFSKRLSLAITAILAFSNKPLLLIVEIGFLMSFAAFFFGIVIAVQKLAYGIPAIGWASVIVSLYFLGGMIMTTLGVIGLYIGSIFNQTKSRPLYVVRRTTFRD